MSVRSGGKVAWETPPTVLPAAGWREDYIPVVHLNTMYATAGSSFSFATAGITAYSTKFTPAQSGVGWHWFTPKDFDPTGQIEIVLHGFNANNAGGSFNYNFRVYGRYHLHHSNVDVAYANFSDLPFTCANVFKNIITAYVNFTPDGIAAAQKYMMGRIDRTDANANDVYLSGFRIRYKYLTGF